MENLRIQWSILLPTSQGSCLIFNVIFADWNGGYWKIDSWLDGINLMADEIRGLLRFFLFSWRKMGISLWRRAGSDVCWSFDFFFFCPLQTERTVVHGGNQMEITTAFKLVEMVNVPRLMAIDVLFSRRRLRIEWLTSVTSCVGRRRGDKTQREERRAPGPFAGVDGRFDVNLPTANNLLPISSWHRS